MSRDVRKRRGVRYRLAYTWPSRRTRGKIHLEEAAGRGWRLHCNPDGWYHLLEEPCPDVDPEPCRVCAPKITEVFPEAVTGPTHADT